MGGILGGVNPVQGIPQMQGGIWMVADVLMFFGFVLSVWLQQSPAWRGSIGIPPHTGGCLAPG